MISDSLLASTLRKQPLFSSDANSSLVRKLDVSERELKFDLSIVSAVTGTSPHIKDKASPHAKSISSTCH